MAARPDKTFMEPIVRRVLARHADNTPVSALTVPESKQGFPRLLMLDMNKWIELSQAHYGMTRGAHAVPVLTAVRKAVAAGRLVVPINGVNAFEAMGPGDDGRRQRLATFMVDLSCNHCMVHEVPVADAEIRNALQWRFFRGEERLLSIPIRTHMVQRGVTAAIGPMSRVTAGNASADAVLNDIPLEPEMSVLHLTDAVSRETIRDMKRREVVGSREVKAIRQHDAQLTFDERLAAEMRNLFAHGSMATRLRVQAEGAGIANELLELWLAEGNNPVQLAKAIPGVWVGAMLMLHRDKSADSRTEDNDGLDLAFLNTAIPYGNYVVTEKLWANVARQSGLAEQYGTEVLSDLGGLPALLEADGRRIG